MSSCPLCHHGVVPFYQDKHRQYVRCQQCELVSVPASFHLDALAEKAHYDCHDNDSPKKGYQQFLSRTLTPLLARIAPNATGLDYGCGEGAVLSLMAESQGVRVANYDLFYHPDPHVLKRQYDFVCLTEVIEHIADAQALIAQLSQLLVPGGILAVMTKRASSLDAFIPWYYKNDPTHINFYSTATFEWLAVTLGWRLEVFDNDVVFFYLPESLA